jgi:hypothetical protein
MSEQSHRSRPWNKDNWCTTIVQPPVPGVSAYRCHNNGIHGGLCSVHRLQQQKRLARKLRVASNLPRMSLTALIIGSMAFGGIAVEVGIAIKCPPSAPRRVNSLEKQI